MEPEIVQILMSVLEELEANAYEKAKVEKPSPDKVPGGKSGKTRKTADADAGNDNPAGFHPDDLTGDPPEGEA